MADQPPLLPIGTLLVERYRVEDALGRGGMGAVYRVFDEVVGEHVALKVLSSTAPSAINDFKHELRLARRVTHKNIGRTFDLGRDGDLLFITMELVVGESLRALVKRCGPLPQRELAAVLRQVAAGLGAAHEAGVVHRDLKPGNVLIESSGRVLIIDFGVSAPHRGKEGGRIVSGTYDYMSPEQVQAEPPEPSHDIYALGLVAFELATARLPFAGPDARSRAVLHVHSEPDLSPLRHAPELAALVAQCLARAAGQRPSAQQLEARFELLAGDTVPPLVVVAARAEPLMYDSRAAEVSLVVAGFDVEGDDEAFGLGAAFAEELSDMLAHSRGLLVVPSHAIRGIQASDLASVRQRASVSHVISGTIRRSADGAVKVTSRLIETRTGRQLWSGQFQGSTAGLIGVGTQVALRIAETLRLELEVLTISHTVSEEAALALLEARRIVRTPSATHASALEAIDRCVALAPSLTLAVPTRAVALVRRYFLLEDSPGNWRAEAFAAVELALSSAPLSPDTHYAAAMLDFAEGRFSEGLRPLARALELAPAHALAHEALGRLECEGGQAARGMARLAMALDIDVARRTSLCMVARAHALRGQLDEFDGTVTRIDALPGPATAEECVLRARVALWFGDARRAQRVLDLLPASGGSRARAFELAGLLAGFVLGEDAYWALHAHHKHTSSRALAPRFRATVHQVAAEYEGARGDPMRAIEHVEAASESRLVDVEWLELCPALDVIRDEPRFTAVRKIVRERAASLWVNAVTPALPWTR